MKKFLVALVGLIVTTQSFGMISPIEAEKIEQQYIENQLKCPKDKPLYYSGNCYPCDTTENIILASFMWHICSETCSNRKYESDPQTIGKQGGNRGFCVLKEQTETESNKFNFLVLDDAEESKKQYEKQQSGCPDDKPLYAGNGPLFSEQCHSCDETESLVMPNMYLDEYCGKICPNRETRSKCPLGQFCVHVADLSSRYKCVLKDSQEKSQNLKTENTKTNANSEKLICTDETPLNVGAGKCEPCDTDNVAYKENCEKCPNRRIVGNFCLKNR